MTGIFIQNQAGTAEIVANGYYGASFNAHVYNQDTDTYLQENIAMSELIEPVTAFNTSVTSNVNTGDESVELNDITDLNVSDRIQIQNYIYNITNIIGNVVYLGKPLRENITSGVNVERVGNLGVYKAQITVVEKGVFTLIGKDSVFGLNSTKIIKVVPKSLETMYKDIKNLEYAILGS